MRFGVVGRHERYCCQISTLLSLGRRDVRMPSPGAPGPSSQDNLTLPYLASLDQPLSIVRPFLLVILGRARQG